MVLVHSAPAAVAAPEAVLFPFDDYSLPFTAGLRLHLVSGKSPGMRAPVVVTRGEEGAPDAGKVRYYGTVIQIDGQLHMWYAAASERKESGRRICYAVSDDGRSWTKPRLGLVEWNGSKDNNIVDLLDGKAVNAANPIIYDDQDPDPERRFKMVFESEVYGNCIAVAWSPDGLSWTVPDWNPVAPMLEQAGLVRYNGVYYVNGQGGRHFGPGRKLVTFASYDFRTWTQSSAMGFRRDPVPPRPMSSEWNTSEEVHLGAGVWDRGNVLIGVYGMWHGHPTSDRSMLTMDLGLVVSSDALHYREPVPDFKLIPAYEETGWTVGTGPSLMQGQGMYNVGNETLHWYESWRDGDVRLASWQRDRLGYFQQYEYPRRPDWLPAGQHFIDVEPQCVSCPLEGESEVAVNVDGLGEHSSLKVEVLDEAFRPVPAYSGDSAAVLREGGLRQPVSWGGADRIKVEGRYRLQLSCVGVRPEDVKLYAVYLASGSD